MYFKGNPASLAICHSTQWPPFLCTQSAISTERSVARAQTKLDHHFADCQEVSASTVWARMWKTVRNFSGSCKQTKMSFHISWPHKSLLMVIYSSASHVPAIGKPFGTAQLSVQRVKSQGSWTIRAKPLWVQLTGCWGLFLFLSRWCQRWAVHVDQWPWLVKYTLSVYHISLGISPLPLYRLQGPPQV